MTMTPHQVFTIAAIGGAAGVFALFLLTLLGAALYAAIAHLFEVRQERAQRRQEAEATAREQQAAHDLSTCNTILDLPTHDPRNPQ